MDGSVQSSPDPLNASQNLHSPSKARRASRVRHSLPLQGSSPKKQTFELDVGNELSPQKIRVTVEAGESDMENLYTDYNGGDGVSPTPGPVPRQRGRTTTTTIPVKGLSDSEEETQQVATPKRGRGRPRKIAGTPAPAKKEGRASTSTQKNGRRKSIGDLVDGDDEDDINFELGKSVEIGRGKGRSRSRSRKGAPKSTPATKNVGSTNDGVWSTAGKKGRGRRKTMPPEEVELLEDEISEDDDHGRGLQYDEPSGSLAPIDGNSQYSASVYSTIQSTAADGADDPDVVIARFDPENETPRRTGWSSPRVIEAPRPSSSRRRSDNYPSPSLSPDKMRFEQSEKDALALVDEQNEGDDYEDEGEDGVSELREFDTILESEGFSVISVDSVPSLREHLSSPAEHEKPIKEPLRNKNILVVQEVGAAAYNDSFSEIPDEILGAATPAKKAQNSRLLSAQDSRGNDSFSSVVPQILEAATPATQQKPLKPLRNQLLGNLSNTTMQAPSPNRLFPTRAQIHEDYEDSFSAIPPAILDAATPAAVRPERPALDAWSDSAPRLGGSPSHATSPSGTHPLTPDETPSPPSNGSSQQEAGVNPQAAAPEPPTLEATANTSNESSVVHSQLPSSPPSVAPRRYTYTSHLRHRQFNPDVTQTPSIVFSSPSLPPPIQPAREQGPLAPAPEQAQRPALSPIARAGRVLQDIVVPSSPRSRSQSLGSPFKSPAVERRSSPDISQLSNPSPSHERHTGPLPRLDLSSHFFGKFFQGQRSKTRQHDDPFRSNTSAPQRPQSPEERQQYSLELPQDRHYSDPRLTNLKSGAGFIHSDNDMSWQAEEEISVPMATYRRDEGPSAHTLSSEQRNLSTEERWSSECTEVIKQVESAGANNVIVIDSNDENFNHEEFDEDEGFGQLLETLNSSSPTAPRAPEPMKDTVEKPRRSKIPSPWRKNSRRLVYSDELSHLSSPPVAAEVALAKDFANEVLSQPVTVRRVVSSETNDDVNVADLSGWQIPQKSNFKPRPRETSNFDLSALLAASPPKRLPVLSRASQHPTSHQGPNHDPGFNEPSSQRMAHPFEPTSRPTGFTPIPQKTGFNPRPRVDSASLVKQPSFSQNRLADNGEEAHFDTQTETSSLPGSRPLSASSPSRSNTLSACRTPSVQVSPLNSDQELSLLSNLDKENNVTDARTSKWTESLRLQSATAAIKTPVPAPATSPTKSCLRSPLKTPLANSYGTTNVSPSKAVAFVSSSPIPSSPQTAPLSSTTWSKDHWLLLDSILQQWKPENQNSSPLSDGSGSKEKRRRNSTRVISRLLGKTVSSQGEKLVLEQWHLEVVDEFRGLVPGWEEKVVAMRVFSLVVGEEKRALRAAAQHVRF